MRQRGLFIAIALLLLVNAGVLGGAAYNRSGEPAAVMKLTERELPIATSYRHEENSGVSLRFNVHHHFYSTRKPGNYDPFEWLDQKKLETLGFTFEKLVKTEEKYDRYKRQLPRRTFAVLEYNGTAWEAWKKRLDEEKAFLEQEEKEGKKNAPGLGSRENIERQLKTGSRLFIIDAGNDPALLKSQYPDRMRYLIMPARVWASYYGYTAASPEPKIRGYIDLLINEMNVPRKFHRKLDAVRKGTDSIPTVSRIIDDGPRYQIFLHSGKRHEPWIADIMSGGEGS